MENFLKIQEHWQKTGSFPTRTTKLGKYLYSIAEQNGIKSQSYDILFNGKDWRYFYNKTGSVRKAEEIKKFKEKVGRFPTKGALREDYEDLKKAKDHKIRNVKGRKVLEEHFLGF